MRKRYIGSIPTKEEAAKLYDYYAIIFRGLRAKTNFSYAKSEILEIAQNFTTDYLEDPTKTLQLLRTMSIY